MTKKYVAPEMKINLFISNVIMNSNDGLIKDDGGWLTEVNEL